MKIHKNCINSKKIFNALEALNLSQIPNVYFENKDFLRRARQDIHNIRANDNTPEQAYASSIKLKKIRFPTSYNQFETLKIAQGNSLIIGDEPDEVLKQSVKFHKLFIDHGIVTRLINFRQFNALPFAEKFNIQTHYIVRFNKSNIDELTHREFSLDFSNIFVFPLKAVRATGEYDIEVIMDNKIRQVMSNINITDYPLRKILIANLNGKNKFLAIRGGIEEMGAIEMESII